MHPDGQPDRHDLLGLAPVAVHPKWQRRGIGSALIQRGLEECRKRGVGAVFVLGEPALYARFGFIPAHTRALRCVYEAPPDAFQVLLLGAALAVPVPALIRYRPEFDSVP
jgi:putative acetyltransferase